jgi:hypothetical protein
MDVTMIRLTVLTLCLTIVVGCATGKQYTFKSDINETDVVELAKDQAQVIFLRPSTTMKIFHSVIFDVTSEDKTIIGASTAESKLVVNFEPGKHRLFATNGLQGHIMEMDVEAGQRYYVLVRPIWGNGFQLRPLKHNTDNEFGQNNEKFAQWLTTTPIKKEPGVEEWYTDFKQSIDKIQRDAEAVWREKSAEQRVQLTLLPHDAASQ